MLTISQTFIIFGILSFVVGEENLENTISPNFFQEDFDYDTLTPTILSLKKKCDKYPDAFPCLYITTDEEVRKNTATSFLNQESNDKESENNTDSFGNETPEENNNMEKILVEIPTENPDGRLAKRFISFRRSYAQANGFKRGPGFRSWGGKRDPSYAEKLMQKKSKFASWGGKRGEKILWNDFSDSEKNKLIDERTKFASWGGKRNENLEEKRSKFASWGGKRNEYLEEKRSKFASWGGKRNKDFKEKKTGFQSWGGKKRSDDLFEKMIKKDKETPIFYDYTKKRNPGWQYNLVEPFKDHVPKRPQFQSWGGKRSTKSRYPPIELYFYPYLAPKYQLRKLSNSEEKRKFSSWGGKRSENANIITDIEKSDINDYNFWNEKQGIYGNKSPIFKNNEENNY